MKSIVFFLVGLFFTISMNAQNPYVGATTVTADGITFEVDLSKYVFCLSNITNTYNNTSWLYRDGRELETLEEYEGIGAEKDKNGEKRALRESFGDEVIKSLRVYKESPMTIFYVVGYDGATWEIGFIMDAIPELLSLPPEVFANLEKKLKQNVIWQLNQHAKELQFFHVFTFVDFKKIQLPGEPNPDPEILPAPIEKLPLYGE